MVSETSASLQVRDSSGVDALLRSVLTDLGAQKVRRSGLSLPDGIFRVQTLEFDEFPTNHRDRERLVRWRLEKGAAFDASGTVLRYQLFPRSDRGCTVLACITKKDNVTQYEDLLSSLGLEPWFVAPSSFNALNYYAPYLAGKGGPAFAFVWVTEGSSATVIVDQGVPRFYRYKEYKWGGAPADVTARLIRELDDSLHFYQHMDRQQSSEVRHLYLAGEPAVVATFAENQKEETALAIETLAPGAVLPSAADVASSLAPAFGAGGVLI